MIAVGRRAPDFAATLDSGAQLTLSSLRGRPVVLFFYPRDATPTCTAEACEFRDHLPRLEALDAVVLGVSPDTVRTHRRFRETLQLPYALVADVDHAIADAYGVWQEKTLFGRRYMGNVRATFVIDRAGRIARVFEKVTPAGHADEVAEALAALR